MNYWMNCSYKQDDIMQKQKFDEKEPELLELDKLFEKAMKKINQQNHDFLAKISADCKTMVKHKAKPLS